MPQQQLQNKTPAVLSTRTLGQGGIASSAFLVVIYFTHWHPPTEVLLATSALFTAAVTYIQNWIERRANAKKSPKRK